jgi:hypothetical protein
MLASPLVWWLSVAACLAAAGVGAALTVLAALPRRASPGRPPRRILQAAAGLCLLAAGAGALWLILTRGPWWLHAPTSVLIARFPTYAPDLDAEHDPVTAELIDRIYEWELPRPVRERIAARCIEAMDPRYSARTGEKAIVVLTHLLDEKHAHTPAILAHLDDPRLRTAIITEVTRITDMGPAVLAAMARIVADDSGEHTRYERCRAAWALRCMGPQAAEAQGALIAALDTPEDPSGKDSVCTAAARALARIGPAATDALPALERIAADPHRPRTARAAASIAASVIRGEHEREALALAALLGHEDPEDRLLAARWLRHIGEDREAGPAAPALAAAVDDTDTRVAALAEETLSRLIVRDNRYLQLVEEVAAARPPGTAPRLHAMLPRLRARVGGLPWTPD